MGTFLFDKIIFGPVFSRRLGQSLGLNLLPTGNKICSFNCIYCECGWTESNKGNFVSVSDYTAALKDKLERMTVNGETADTLTFAGNGEPTLHPEFDKIIDITIDLRNKYMPGSDIAVLSNSTTLHRKQVFDSFLKIEKNIMKLDAGSEEMFRQINQPGGGTNLDSIIENLQKFNGNVIIQTLLLKETFNNTHIDNTSKDELVLLGKHLRKINPHTLMLYSVARGTPVETLEAVSNVELNHAAELLSSFIPDCNIEIY
jgi:wyosine [tRNA(Phe)-imidazoG37] synthetase (radical SAM superfamily)